MRRWALTIAPQEIAVMSQTVRRTADYGVGIALIFLVVGASAAIDITSAWKMSSETEERAILVAVAIAAVMWKSFGSIKLNSLRQERRYPAMIFPGIFLLISLAVSMTFEVNFYKRIFGDAAAARTDESDARQSIKTELSQVEKKISDRGGVESVDELKAKISSMLDGQLQGDKEKRSLAAATTFCTNDAMSCAPSLVE
jgi:hypothetical protein